MIASRQLMRSCQIYQDSLSLLQRKLEEQNAFGAIGGVADAQLQTICDQIKDDTSLLKEISDQTQKITQSTEKYSVLRNAIMTLTSGRAEKLKELEQQLMTRVQTISMLMVTIKVRSQECRPPS